MNSLILKDKEISSSAWKFLLKVIKPYWLWYILMLQAPILTAFYVFANNYVLKLLVDAFSIPTAIEYGQLVYPISLFIFAQIALDVVWRISNYAECKSKPYVRQKILSLAYNYIQYHSFSYFQNTPSGTIISKLKGIVDGYDGVFDNIHHGLGKNFCNIFVSVLVLAFVNLEVFGFMLIWCLLVILIMLPMIFRLNILSNQAAESKHQVIGSFADNITNIFSLFYFAKRKIELDRINKYMQASFVPAQVKLYKYDFKFNLIGSALYWLMLISVFLFMIYLRKTSQVSTGDFLFVILTTIAISFDLWAFMSSLCDFIKEIGDFKASFLVIATPHDEVDSIDSQEFNIQKGAIFFKNVSFAYADGKSILNGLNLAIKPGEKIGLIGHSGAGKSTLIFLLLKNFKLINGDILIDNNSINRINSDSLRSQISLIPQDIMLFHRSIGENIAYAKENASGAEIQHAAKLANIHDFIELLPAKYDTLVGERGIKLSGGQRQRIAIARAILKNAPILILDEATSSLDSITEQEIQKSINLILKQSKATVIAIAHRLSTIRHMDRIVVMDRGRIIEEGTFVELMSNQEGVFKKLWDSQVNGMIF